MEIGDRVKSLFPSTLGEEGVLVRLSRKKYVRDCWLVKGFTVDATPEDGYAVYSEKYLEIIGKGNNMNIKSTWNAIKRSEPEKTFHKLGITDDNDDLTEEGLSLYQNWKFQQDKTTFKTEVADKIAAAQDDEE